MSEKMIQINGAECKLLEIEEKNGSLGIHTLAGTFWMKPVVLKSGQKSFWMGENGYALDLPLGCPRLIRPITFDEPDLTDQFPEEVKADYNAHLKYCRDTGAKEISFEQYKTGIAVFEIWQRHGTPERVVQYGYIADDFLIYHKNLEKQHLDPGCIYQFKWVAEYENGDVIFFGCLAGPEPLPKELV